MAKGKSTWKYNKLLTGRRNYFADGTADIFGDDMYYPGTTMPRQYDISGFYPGPITKLDTPNSVYNKQDLPNSQTMKFDIYEGPSKWDTFNKGFSNFMSSDAMKNLNIAMGSDRNGKALNALRQSGMGTSNPWAMSADMTGQVISLIEEATAKPRLSVNEVIGLAHGGRVHRFDGGGDMGSMMGGGGDGLSKGMGVASTATALVGNFFEQANKAPDMKQTYHDVANKQLATAPTVDSYDAIAQDAANTATLSHVNYKDILGGSWFNLGNTLSASAQGAGTGAMFGPIGAVAGGVLGAASSVFGGLVAKNRAKRRARTVNRLVDATNSFNERSIANRAEAVEDDMLNRMEQGWYALGGPLQFAYGGGIHINPENKGKFTATKKRTGKTTEELTHSKNPLTRKRAIFAQNAKKWHHAFGGDLLTHGANFDSGITYIGNGGTHEENPYEGVLFGVDAEGTPNLVEEGEVIYNDYVFSNRLTVPKAVRNKYKLRGTKNMTFADAAKKLSKESEERPNDPISKNGLDALMDDLISAQETLKQSQQSNQFALGGMVNKFKQGTSNIQRSSKAKATTMAEAWASTVGAALINRLKKIASLEGDAREAAIDALIAENKDIQDSYYNNVYDKNTWGAEDYVVGGGEHQDLFNKYGWNDLANFGNIFTYRNASSDVKDKWSDNKIGDQTILRMLGDTRYISKEKLEEIKDLSKKLGLSWDALDDKNTLTYFNRMAKTEDKTPMTEPEPDSKTDSKEAAPETEDIPITAEKLPTWMRYAPIAASGIGVLTDALGITNKPDYSNADMILNAAREGYQRVGWNPIGNYLRYDPFDIDYTTNKMNAEAGATRRALLQNAGLNRGTAAAQLLAADNNYLNQIGELGIKAMQYNQGLKKQVEDFNRSTNITNSQGLLQADMANQQAYAQAAARRLQGTTYAAQMREGIRQMADANKAANINNLIEGIGNLGQENDAKNWRNAMYLSGVFGGKMTPEALYLMDMGAKPNAKGGKIKRRKKGLTF